MKSGSPAPHVQRAIQAGQAHSPGAQAKLAAPGRPAAAHVQATVATIQAKTGPAAGPPQPSRPAAAAHVQRAIAACQPKRPEAPRPPLAVHAQAAIAAPRPAPFRPSPLPAARIVQLSTGSSNKRKATDDGRRRKKKPRIGEGDGDSEDEDFVYGVDIPVDTSLVQDESDKRKRPSKLKSLDSQYRRDVVRAQSPDIDEESIRLRRERRAKKENKQKKSLMVATDTQLTKHYKVTCRRCGKPIRMDSNYKELGVRLLGRPQVPPLGHDIDYVEYEPRLFERGEEVKDKYRSAYLSIGAWDPRNVQYEHFDCNSEAPKGSGSTTRGITYVDDHHEDWLQGAKSWVKKGELPNFFDDF